MNSQEDEDDRGFVYKLGFDAHRIKLDEFYASLHSSWNQSFLGRRSPRTGDAKLILLRDFGGGVSDSLAINYCTQRREILYGTFFVFSKIIWVCSTIFFTRDAKCFEVSEPNKVWPRSRFLFECFIRIIEPVN